MSSIIEKLGITPGPWRNQKGFNTVYTTSNPESKTGLTIALFKDCNQCPPEQIMGNANLIAAAPEMLEALIDRVYNDWECLSDTRIGNKFKDACLKDIKIIEHATGKTWEQIRELIK